MKVCLDAGHGGKDPGACNGNCHEADIALKIVLKLGEFLSEKGVEVLYSRTEDVYPEWKDRVGVANDNNADVYVSVHLNAAENKLARGTEVLVHPSTGTKTRALAQAVLENIVDSTGFNDRGIKERSDLYVLKATKMPAILIETGFISNDSECELLSNKTVQACVAETIADAIYAWEK